MQFNFGILSNHSNIKDPSIRVATNVMLKVYKQRLRRLQTFNEKHQFSQRCKYKQQSINAQPIRVKYEIVSS